MASAVGDRIKDLRERKGLSQVELVAGLPLAPSYVSLIERGRRTPSRRVLETIARRLGCSAEFLLTGRRGPGVEELELELRFAELALRSGDPRAARDRFAQVARDATEQMLDDVAQDARWGRSRAEKALGNFETVIDELEALNAEPELKGTFSKAAVAMTLAHTYLEIGESGRATDVAEAGLSWCHSQPVTDADELAELGSTLVGCYYQRGELSRAHLLARRIIDQAEQAPSVRARAAAYWNAGLVAEARGDLRNARKYTERALALYSETDNARATASLRMNTAWLILRSPAPDTEQAAELLSRAIQELSESGTPADVARAETELARCRLLEGDAGGAVALATSAVDRLAGGQSIELARARAVLARAESVGGDLTAAAESYGVAATLLDGAGATARAAAVWREVGDGLRAMGRLEEALAAYQRIADAVGVPPWPFADDRAHAAGTRRQGSRSGGAADDRPVWSRTAGDGG